MDATSIESLNAQQREAVEAGDEPLLILAGAGTGKTNTLAHRVARLIDRGVDPSRILLLTFTRRAASEMVRRVQGILRRSSGAAEASAGSVWGGTFHAISNRLLRIHAEALGLGPAFTVLDRSDAEDLLGEVRGELGFESNDVRFPRKSTCAAIYSRCVNAQSPPTDVLHDHFPWCAGFETELRELFAAYVSRKQERQCLDYDDLLLWWYHLMNDAETAATIRGRFDAVLVDEYQDTNALQASILKGLCPQGRGLTVVGDDAQSIYGFRAASVRNILEFPAQFPGVRVVKLEQNYRSVQPILDASNAVMDQSPTRLVKRLFATRAGGERPRLVTVEDEAAQCDHVIARVLEHVEAGIPLRRQAILFRATHHSDALEVELQRRNIPFVKYGGLKFLEAAHIKDVLAFLRLADNPRDPLSATRVLMLMDGIGPTHARKAVAHLAANGYALKSWMDYSAPAAASEQWSAFVDLMLTIGPDELPLTQQVALVRAFYAPILERRYEQPEVRARDLEQLEQIASGFASRTQFVSEITLDPPAGTQDLAGAPLLEEDYLVLSTIHSAKGCEWDCVTLIHCSDGNIPSDMACGTAEEIEEERRLLYVALTRARDFLEVVFPLKYYAKKWSTGDRHSLAQLSRFIPAEVASSFDRVTASVRRTRDQPMPAGSGDEIRRKIAGMWT
jgi:DNA helicase-2/ATP-dependent DNA helicase PcrA